MRALSQLDIEAELSYAYLHTVAARAGLVCRVASGFEDKAGIDAALTGWAPFPDGGYLEEVDVKVQLKSTSLVPRDDGRSLSYFLQDTSRYDALRAETAAVPRILMVLFLPGEPEHWVGHSADELVLRKCAYWVSLRGAPATRNTSGITVKLPKTQVVTPGNLLQLMGRLSRRDFPRYQEGL
jgi:hypothetical protein